VCGKCQQLLTASLNGVQTESHRAAMRQGCRSISGVYPSHLSRSALRQGRFRPVNAGSLSQIGGRTLLLNQSSLMVAAKALRLSDGPACMHQRYNNVTGKSRL